MKRGVLFFFMGFSYLYGAPVTNWWQGGSTAFTSPKTAANWSDAANWQAALGVPNDANAYPRWGTARTTYGYITNASPLTVYRYTTGDTLKWSYVSDQPVTIANGELTCSSFNWYAPVRFNAGSNPYGPYPVRTAFCDDISFAPETEKSVFMCYSPNYFRYDRYAKAAGETRTVPRVEGKMWGYDMDAYFFAPESSATDVTCTFDQEAGSAYFARVGGSAATVISAGTLVTGTGIPEGTFVRRIFPDKAWIELSRPATQTLAANTLTFKAFTPRITATFEMIAPNGSVVESCIAPLKFRDEDRFDLVIETLYPPAWAEKDGDYKKPVIFGIGKDNYEGASGWKPGRIVLRNVSVSSATARYDYELGDCDVLFDAGTNPGLPKGYVRSYKATSDARLSVTGDVTATMAMLDNPAGIIRKCGTGTLQTGLTTTSATGRFFVEEGTLALTDTTAGADPSVFHALDVSALARVRLPVQNLKVDTLTLAEGATFYGPGFLRPAAIAAPAGAELMTYANIQVETGDTVDIPADVTLKVAYVRLADGTYLPVGTYRKGDAAAGFLTGEGTLTVALSTTADPVTRTWDGTAWDATPAFTGGTEILAITGPTLPTLPAAVDVYGLTIDTSADATLGTAGNNLSIGRGGVTLANSANDTHVTVDLACDLTVCAQDATFDLGMNRLNLKGRLLSCAGLKTTDSVTVTGLVSSDLASYGILGLYGDNAAFQPALEFLNRAMPYVYSDTGLGSPARTVATANMPIFDGARTNDVPLVDRVETYQSNFDKLQRDESRWFVQRGAVTMDVSGTAYFQAYKARIEGGLAKKAGVTFYLRSIGQTIDSIVFAEKPINLPGVYFNADGVYGIRLDVTGNVWKYLGINRTLISCDRDFVLATEGGIKFGSCSTAAQTAEGYPGGHYGVLKLNGHDQRIAGLWAEIDTVKWTNSPEGHGYVESPTPATLEIRPDTDWVKQPILFTGQAALHLNAAHTLDLTNALSTTAGALTIDGGGTIRFSAGSGWQGPVAIVDGTLKVAAATPEKALSKWTTDLTLPSAQNQLVLEGGTVTVRSLVIGDRPIRRGLYGGSACTVAGADTGTIPGLFGTSPGALYVRRLPVEGLRIIFR